MPTSKQWREAANVLRSTAAEWDEKADDAICGMVSNSGPNREPLACGYVHDHDGPHSWSTLPTFTRTP